MAGSEAATAVETAVRRLEGMQFGSLRSNRASGELGIDYDGDPVVRVQVTVSDLPDPEGDWPLEDVEALEHEARRLINEIPMELPYTVITVFPETLDSEEERDEDVADAFLNSSERSD